MPPALILDIETAPDRLTLTRYGGRPRDAASRLWLHGLRAISWLRVDHGGDRHACGLTLTSLSIAEAPRAGMVAEREALDQVERALAGLGSDGTLISFNGNRHDLPFLQFRRQHHYLFGPSQIDAFCGTPRHRDLWATLGPAGLRRPALAEACAALQIPHALDRLNQTGPLVDPALGKSQIDVLATFLLDCFDRASAGGDPRILARGWAALACWCRHHACGQPHLLQFATAPGARAAIAAAKGAAPP